MERKLVFHRLSTDPSSFSLFVPSYLASTVFSCIYPLILHRPSYLASTLLSCIDHLFLHRPSRIIWNQTWNAILHLPSYISPDSISSLYCIGQFASCIEWVIRNQLSCIGHLAAAILHQPTVYFSCWRQEFAIVHHPIETSWASRNKSAAVADCSVDCRG